METGEVEFLYRPRPKLPSEHLAEMNRGLMALEEEPGNRESLDGIFRSVHTIKGMAAAMGYDVATRLAHNIESVLDELRGVEQDARWHPEGDVFVHTLRVVDVAREIGS